MSDLLQSHACRVDFFSRANSSWSDVDNSFSSILQCDINKQEMNLLYKQFVDFPTLSEEEVSNEALADAIIKEFEDEDSKTQNEYRMDVLWYHLQSIKSPIGNNKSFNFLFEIVQVVLLIPHSNATIDCFFLL